MPNHQSPVTDNSPRTYLVTGAAGFIAAKVCEQLLAAGHTVVGVDNLNDYYDVRLKDYRLSRLLGISDWLPGPDPKRSVFASSQSPITNHSGRFIFRFLDIEDLAALEAVFVTHKFDAVFNLAARAGVRASLENPDLYYRTNVIGEENVLKGQVKYGVNKHVLASSSSVYAGCLMPFTEAAPIGAPQSPYAGTKRQAELLAFDYHQKHGLDVSVLRYFTVFGPAGRPDMAPFRFVKGIAEGTPITLYGDGTQARDFTYVDDIARGTILAAELLGRQTPDDGQRPADGEGVSVASPSGLRPQVSGFSARQRPGFDIINLGGGRNPTNLQTVITVIERAVGRKAVIDRRPPHAADMRETWADIGKAKKLLAWEPHTSPEIGFQQTSAWYADNRQWLSGIHV